MDEQVPLQENNFLFYFLIRSLTRFFPCHISVFFNNFFGSQMVQDHQIALELSFLIYPVNKQVHVSRKQRPLLLSHQALIWFFPLHNIHRYFVFKGVNFSVYNIFLIYFQGIKYECFIQYLTWGKII